MKKLLIAATAILITAGSLQAQTEKQDSKQFHQKGMHTRKGMQHINLSDEQKKQVKELNAGYEKKFSELRNNNSITMGDYKSKTAALKKEQHEKMQALLTPEQKTQLAAQRKEGDRKMKEGQAKRVDQMKTKLGLSDEQATKIKAGQAGLQDKIKAIHQDQKLSDSEKKEQVRSAMKQQRDEMQSILTPEQLQKMKSGRKSRGVESAK
jgi:Spy/CpxP family protein refolding chaperone